MMLAELETLLTVVPDSASALDYHAAITQGNLLAKTTESTRLKSYRHLRELYGLDEALPIFGLLRSLYAAEPTSSLTLLAFLVAWTRDPLFRATTSPVLDASVGARVETESLAKSIEEAFPNQYTPNSCSRVSRNAASSWTQSGHLVGRTKKARQQVKPSATAVTMALFLGDVAGFRGAAAFANPWCRLLDLTVESARALGQDAHRAGLLNLRAMGDIVELSFPRFAKFQVSPT